MGLVDFVTINETGDVVVKHVQDQESGFLGVRLVCWSVRYWPVPLVSHVTSYHHVPIERAPLPALKRAARCVELPRKQSNSAH